MMNWNCHMVLILCQVKCIIQKQETLTKIPPIHAYMNRMNDRLVLKIEDGYMLELQTPEIMKLFDSTKKFIDKTKNGENVPSLEIVGVVLAQCNLVDINVNESLRYYTLLCQILCLSYFSRKIILAKDSLLFMINSISCFKFSSTSLGQSKLKKKIWDLLSQSYCLPLL